MREGFLNRVIQLYGAERFPRIFVETGTFHGNTVDALCKHFDELHTVELSEKWYRNALERFKNTPSVVCHLGDSGDSLDELIGQIDRAAMFYLDAHFSGGETAFGREEVPLLRELSILSKRSYQDVIVIDDLRLVGKKGTTGLQGHPLYPPMEFDWTAVSLSAIRAAFRPNRWVFWKETDDRIVIFLNQSIMRFAFTKLKGLGMRIKEQDSLWKHRVEVARLAGRGQPLRKRISLLFQLWQNRSHRLGQR